MKKNYLAIIIDGKKYEYKKTKYDGAYKTCADCALKKECDEYADGLLCGALGEDEDSTSNFQLTEDAAPIQNQKNISEQKAYDDYQDASLRSKERGDQLAWAFIVLLVGMMIGDHSYLEFYVGAACALAYMLLSTLQSVWQTVAIWIIKNCIKRHNLTIEDYPQWVGGWAWVFYYSKIALLTIGAIYVVWRFVEPLFDFYG
jgi:hypothetical protein